MSRSASILITGDGKKTLNPSVVLNALLEAGWSYDDHGHITFSTSADLSKTQWAPLRDWPSILQQLNAAYLNGLTPYVSLLVEGEARGGNLLFFPDSNSICLSPEINRKEIISVFRATDYSWYLSRLLKPLENLGYDIINIECTDY